MYICHYYDWPHFRPTHIQADACWKQRDKTLAMLPGVPGCRSGGRVKRAWAELDLTPWPLNHPKPTG